MIKIMKKINLKSLIKILIICLVYLIIYFAPYTLDDWAWGTNIGINRLKSGFSQYNGRWAGNLLVILLTRNRILKTIVMGTVILVTINLMVKLIDVKKKTLLYIISILFLLMPCNMFSQTVVWTSGFTNYVVPIALVLLYLCINKNIIEQKLDDKRIYIIPMFFLGFIISLFVENITIYSLVLGIFMLCYVSIRKRKLNLPNLRYVIGSISGTVLMFSNSGYINVIKSQDGYRTFALGSRMIDEIKSNLAIMYKCILQDNLFLILVLSSLTLLLIYRYFKQNQEISNIKKSVLYISICTIITYITYLIFICVGDNQNIFIYANIRKIIEGLMALFFAFAIICTIIISIEDKKKKIKILFFLASITIIVAPLFFVTPITSRIFYSTYVFFILIICEITTYLFKEQEINNYEKILMFITFILIVFYTIIFLNVHIIETIRNNYIEEIKDTEKQYVFLPKIPLSQYMHMPNPNEQGEMWTERFLKFYDIENKNLLLIFVDYDEWKLYINK